MLQQVSKRQIDSNASGVKVVFCVRNEKFRLPFFLDYYRQLGVSEFFAIDNNSDDETGDYLLQQEDVNLFYTEASYKESNAGRDWTTELARKYCIGNWCLTLDVDEFFVYPFSEFVGLPALCEYLDRWGYQGLFSVFLDFYAKGPLSSAQYREGSSTFDVCDYFDSADSYSIYETPNFPFLQIKGGIRQRKFWNVEDPRSGPSMRKLVLVKWDEEFEYLHSTHSCSSIRLADITAAIAHFKFMAHLKEYAKSEVERNDRVANSGDWKVYASALDQEDISFYDSKYSVKFEGSKSLLKDGHINCSLRYFDHAVVASAESESRNMPIGRDSIAEKVSKSGISYRQLNQIWSGVGLFSQNFGSGAALAQDLFRIEEDIDSLIHSQSWKLTYPLRKFGAKHGFCDQRSIPEEMVSQSVYSRFNYTFKSAWWELTAPLRLVKRVVKKILGKIK